MLSDQQGNPLTGARAESLALYDESLAAFNLYQGDPVALLDRAIDISPRFPMAVIAKAVIFATSSEPGAMSLGSALLDALPPARLNDRERSHVAALQQLFAGEWTKAGIAYDLHNLHYPRDLLAIQAGHLIDFFRANARNLRDRIARVLPAWSPSVPGYPVLLGMHAFGLEECGDYARAEDRGREAVELNPFDCWAHHAVAHVMEMQGRAEDGIGWMRSREPYWAADDNAFKVHNGWHLALCHLELGQADAALELYDSHLRRERSAVALDLVDASALLWRLEAGGHDVGVRWQELAQCWDRHADGHTYPFNDWHAVMAYLGAGRGRDVERLLRSFAHGSDWDTEVAGWARRTAVPLVEGFAAFHAGDHGTATERLVGARHIVNAFGGSHAQRDIIDWTLTESAIRGGFDALADALVNERLALRPRSKVNHAFRARLRTRRDAARNAA